MLNVGLIGFGYWGPNLARNFAKHPSCVLKRIADRDVKRRQMAADAYGQTEIVEDASLITTATDIDVVVIATPVFTHFEIAMDALKHGKHVWIEKPIATTADQGMQIAELAAKKGLVTMVDHTFLFTGAVREIKSQVETGSLGDLYYYDSIRVNLGLFQHDINVIWDLAPHDLSIMDYILGPKARAVSATGSGHFGRGKENVGYLSVYYDNNLMAHINVNWLSPVKIRKTLIGGSKSMLVWDDLISDESIKIYDRGVHIETKEGVYNLLASYRMGAMHAPIVKSTEALWEEVNYMVRCISDKVKPHNDAEAGARIVRLLEASDRSLKQNCATIEIKE